LLFIPGTGKEEQKFMRCKIAILSILILGAALAASAQEWPQWAHDPQHTGRVPYLGQVAARLLDDVVYDPFVEAEKAGSDNDLLVHYQVPLLDGQDVFMEFKSGTFTDITHWETQIWNEKRLRWQGNHLVEKWSFQSDWKPTPFGTIKSGPVWEPVFHAALANGVIYIPGAGGTVFKVNKTSGALITRINPFGSSIDQDIFVAGPLSADAAGNLYYNAIKLAHGNGWNSDAVNSWLVKIAPNNSSQTTTFASLNPGAPGGNDKCVGVFNINQLPWPPTPDAVPPDITCGSQRPGINVAPAIAPDGTIYTVSVAQFSTRTPYLLAVNADLTPKWAASLRDRFNDGCDDEIPPSGTPGGCRAGAHPGVDPAQNRPGAGRVLDDGTSSPVVAPDGSVYYGAYTRYNYAQGHMMHFSSTGQYLGGYHFGWDITPGIRPHDGTYSVITKENHYGEVGSYCNDPVLCPEDRTATDPTYPEEYFVSSLSPNLTKEWSWQNTNTLSCSRDANGNVTCVSDHPAGFEWCVNGPAIDSGGNIYNNSEDGNVYVIRPDGTLRENLFLKLALGAAYTPLSIMSDGKVLAQNDGHLFVVGQ
jgi:hypothetical protein